ncbi:MAG: hypothetical protein JSW05_04025 [Candidatus Thorarchaeota archaeon]|nr:MAG: hypothetical protein JSW05_04025 [Candidatus Thorarchaeota archaeon]
MTECSFDSIRIKVRLGPYKDDKLDLALMSSSVLAEVDSGAASGGLGITIQEQPSAEKAEYWPVLTMDTPNRRSVIYEAVKNTLDTANRDEAERIGIFTLGLEVARVPSWEVAEEISKAVYDHSKLTTHVREVVVVASSPTQVSSFQYALQNISVISS